MRFVAIETSTARGGLALFEGGTLRREILFPEGLIHGREITPRLDELLRGAGWTARSLEGIAVSIGPGSYTGLRVGVTAAKTLAFCLRIPVVGESSLLVLAAGQAQRAATGAVPLLVPALDGRQGFFFWAAFRLAAGGLVRVTPDSVSAGSDLEARTDASLLAVGGESRALVFGDGAEAFLRAVKAPGWSRDDAAPALPGAATLGALIGPRLREAAFDPEAVHRLEPAYLRATEAERKLAQQRAAARLVPR